ncbi:MAG: PQQ-dependent sugar dehydrogenase [Gemmatimonadaceae bacterium]
MRRLRLIALAAGLACTNGAGPESPPPTGGEIELRLQEVASGLSSPVYVTAPADDARLFVVEQQGRIRIIENGQLLATPFLDISQRVSTGGERGMLSLAFHPQYRSNGLFFVYFTGPGGEIRVERFTVSGNANVASPASAKVILAVPHPRSNHNGGLARFGPDGMLYLGLGDGGGAGDPDANGQNANTLLGALLRIDVDAADPYAIPPGNPYAGITGARGEVWATGLRNPWRFAFDAEAGNLYVADVGQGRLEEVNVVRADRAGVNYGWNILEGTACYNSSNCDRQGLELPALEYDHSGGACSVTGGFVYRGAAIPEITGHYFYSDYCAGFLKSFRYVNGAASDERTWSVGNVGNVASFGEDSAGELYVVASSRVYRIMKSP